MQTYRPRRPPDPPQNLPSEVKKYMQDLHRWMVEDSQAVEKAANASNDQLQARYLSAEPSKPQDGAIVGADGAGWDPGSGKGFYRVVISGSTVTYTFLG